MLRVKLSSMRNFFLQTSLILLAATTQANDFCVTGVKGTATSHYTFKVTQTNAAERMMTLFDSNHRPIFHARVENRFTQFNTSGYGVCSVTGKGIDELTGASLTAELKVAPHSKTACRQYKVPTSIEYLTLKIVPKGTTLGDELTAYAHTIVPCP